jgi:NDP-sugar pyrophosphorylase family protein
VLFRSTSELTIFLGSEHRTNLVSTYPFDEIVGQRAAGCNKTKGDVIIGNDVWIGFGVIILSGVTIGDGAVIGAGSLVSKNVEPYTIAAGNPCKIIRKRFSDEVIKKLLEIKWWNWSKEEIIKNVPYLESSNIDDFVGRFYNRK